MFPSVSLMDGDKHVFLLGASNVESVSFLGPFLANIEVHNGSQGEWLPCVSKVVRRTHEGWFVCQCGVVVTDIGQTIRL